MTEQQPRKLRAKWSAEASRVLFGRYLYSDMPLYPPHKFQQEFADEYAAVVAEEPLPEPVPGGKFRVTIR